MSDYSGRIMNIRANAPLGTTASERVAYNVGHRDARHAAAEIALKAEAKIAELEARLAKAEAARKEAGGNE